MRRDGEPDLRIDTVEVGRFHEREHAGGSIGAAFVVVGGIHGGRAIILANALAKPASARA